MHHSCHLATTVVTALEVFPWEVNSSITVQMSQNSTACVLRTPLKHQTLQLLPELWISALNPMRRGKGFVRPTQTPGVFNHFTEMMKTNSPLWEAYFYLFLWLFSLPHNNLEIYLYGCNTQKYKMYLLGISTLIYSSRVFLRPSKTYKVNCFTICLILWHIFKRISLQNKSADLTWINEWNCLPSAVLGILK